MVDPHSAMDKGEDTHHYGIYKARRTPSLHRIGYLEWGSIKVSREWIKNKEAKTIMIRNSKILKFDLGTWKDPNIA